MQAAILALLNKNVITDAEIKQAMAGAEARLVPKAQEPAVTGEAQAPEVIMPEVSSNAEPMDPYS